mmetsp:Transcript_1440/g.2060  ORF Transcript_1440/g.2060 Transcript_1440/m.2060 type:complete len:1013 (-) Transcript_1440:130-3168(-)|eukprot:CAMPEP_0194080150 /NCGR_PEP_ID=MMETSP0149-20130528/6216_1 /TAXON_ID=122233 /ORGANISM="Chaetoceros debilis, Strain MM31A-1" /LENGTH=1012 /DNA_ID=CAMNT_0038761795 /DNA_START=251 /DNA_END=3289 /DNA_ORIENTATION=-
MLHYRYKNLLLASMLYASASAFAPNGNGNSNSIAGFGTKAVSTKSNSPALVNVNVNLNLPFQKASTFKSSSSSSSLSMASDDFNEMKYTESAWSCMASLTKAAEYYQTYTVESPMLLDVMLNPTKHPSGADSESAAAAKRTVEKILLKADIDVSKLRQFLEQHMSQQPKISGGYDGAQQKVLGTQIVRVLEHSRNVQKLLNDSFISSEGLLLSLAKEDKFTVDTLATKFGKSYNDVLTAVQAIRETSGPANTRSAENMYDALYKYGIDFTAQAEEGELDPVIGRDDEIRRAIQILSRRRKNNPVLIGDPGVGKTAVAEGIAQRMISGDVPDSLKSPCKLIGLDMGALIAGASMRGEFEERLKAVLEEVQKSDGEIVLFIDEMHTVVGAGAAQGSMDASNLLKPALARGKLRCIGATTINEYRKYIEKDKALERRFQQVMIDQPSPEDTVSILRGLKPRYELHHGVRIRDEALLAAAQLSHRYIPDRFLPDKAIDLVDEACAKLKNELTSKPTMLDEIDRRIIQMEMERLSLRSDAESTADSDDASKKKSAASVDRLRKLDQEINELKIQSDELNTRWESERGGVDRLQEVKEQISQVNLDIEKAERDYNLNEAAELKFSKLPQLEVELQKLEKASETKSNVAVGAEKMLRDEVTADDIANVVAVQTGIPPQRMLETERDRILKMGNILNNRVIGQSQAVEIVTEAIQRSRAGLNDPTKPIASLVFLGPTGVGKTELCKALAEFMFDTEDAIIRIDMSEYMEKHTVSRLVGAPPGYVGYDEGGQLTDAVRRQPYSVILFDEMEKAHPDVFNIMLQMLDDGRITDSKGTSVNFCNTIIIFTSNVGSQEILDLNGSSDADSQEIMKERVTNAMKDKFKPEFLNRLDEYVIFNSLNKTDLREIVKLEAKRLEKRLADRQIVMILTEKSLDYLADVGFDPVYGARPLKRTIQRELETNVAKGILRGDYKNGDTISVDADEVGLVIKRVIDGTVVPTDGDDTAAMDDTTSDEEVGAFD